MQLMQLTALQPAGQCHINFSPVKNPPPHCSATYCQNSLTTCFILYNFR